MAKIVSSKTLFKNYFLKLSENTIDFGNNIIEKHVDLYRRPAVCVFPFDSDSNIYLIRQYRYLWDSHLIEAVAGIIEDGESARETAVRELKEEAGIVAKELIEVKELYLAGSFTKIRQNIMFAKNLKFEDPTPEATEEIELLKMSIDEAIGKIYSGEINTGSTIVGILLLSKMLKDNKI